MDLMHRGGMNVLTFNFMCIPPKRETEIAYEVSLFDECLIYEHVGPCLLPSWISVLHCKMTACQNQHLLKAAFRLLIQVIAAGDCLLVKPPFVCSYKQI